MKCCCFLGHRKCPAEKEEDLQKEIIGLIKNQNVGCFYIGTHGEFDRMAYKVLNYLKNKYEIEVYVVLAYLNREDLYYKEATTIFPDELTKTPPRFAIRKRNDYMINQSEYVVAYINTPFSNAFKNIKEAIKKRKIIINLGDYDIGIRE